ncbi:MAG: DUF3164 family protein [Magnetococcales bacterium]|nr:DUF3164 family protein [Magnetococcales bacterium]
MAVKATKKWIDPSGNEVPAKFVPKLDKMRDKMVAKLLKAAEAEEARLKQFRALVDKHIREYLQFASNEADVKPNRVGNYTFTNFSATQKVQVKIGKTLQFDDRLQSAKVIIDACVDKWSEGSRDEIRVLIFDAFKTDQKNQVDTKRILGLAKLNIKDPDWVRAMDLISKSVTVIAQKSYITFSHRQTGAEWQSITLDLARIS